MRKARLAALILATLATPALAADPPYSITLGPRTACATPTTTRQARAEGGATDVTTPSANVLAMAMSGSVAANAFLGGASAATETFHLEQEFEIAGPAPARLTLDSALVGFVRSKHKAGACVKLARAKVCPVGAPDSPLVAVHPPLCVEGDDGRLCNQHLPPIKVDGMPMGRYVLSADFVLTSDAAGLADGHSAADFSPSTAPPADWVRTRDPFQGVDKKDFGFKLTLAAEPADAPPPGAQAARRRDPALTRVAAKLPAPAPARPAPPTGLDRHSGPR